MGTTIPNNSTSNLIAISLASALLLSGLVVPSARAQSFDADPSACPPGEVAGIVTSAVGNVIVDGRPAKAGLTVCAGQEVETFAGARAGFRLSGVDTPLRLRERSKLIFPKSEVEDEGIIDLLAGWIYVLGKPRRDYHVNTPFITAGIEGTEFAVEVTDGRTQIYLFEGTIRTTSAEGATDLAAGSKLSIAADGEIAVAMLDQSDGRYAPLRAAGRDVVAWTLHYPDIIATDPAGLDGALVAASELLRAGNVDQAQASLRPLADDARALALQSVIATSQEDAPLALELADRAIALAPDLAAPQLAMSYVRQAQFDLAAARDAAGRAAELEPDNPLARARLAEIELMLGNRAASRKAAEAASGLAANGRTAIVEGFAALAERRAGRAERKFAEALSLDSQDPLAWLGRGLVQILQGDVADGRESLETAILHDPNNALIRAYLGKAYFEERRNGDAETQFAMAQDLDPQDPTAYFYDAVLKQLDNRPIEALFALDEAIARNDNRAVYRSRLLLDQDRAARNASLARIYDELGLEQPAIGLAATALADNPADHAAHRFLADIYARRAGFEVARSSELLQAQLLQPLGLNAIQPSASFTDLNLISSQGPSEAGFNEFNGLFERDRVQATINSIAGQQGTLGIEAVASAQHDWVALSAGVFDFQSDGHRPNNDVNHAIANLFAQAQLTPDLSLQLELRDRDTEQGDISEDFDPDGFKASERREISETIPRIGFRFDASPNSTVLGSLIYNDRRESLTENEVLDVDIENDSRAMVAELETIHVGEGYSLQAGVGHYRAQLEDDRFVVFPLPFPPGPDVVENSSTRTERSQSNAHIYASVQPWRDVELIGGLSYDNYFERDRLGREQLSPKLGVIWDVAAWLRLRGALFQALKRDLAIDQTLEPTSIAGFPQFFDLANGTELDFAGIGLDFQPTRTLRTGIELSWLSGDVPVNSAGNTGIENYEFERQRASAYASEFLSDDVVLAGSIDFERLQESAAPGLVDRPDEMETLRLPASLSYFDPRGWFAEAKAEYITQEIDRGATSTMPTGRDDELFASLQVGYRLPQRRGRVAVQLNNLLDRQMQFQDDNFISSRETRAAIQQGRSILVTGTLHF